MNETMKAFKDLNDQMQEYIKVIQGLNKVMLKLSDVMKEVDNELQATKTQSD